jgi:diguanylate cyclase (GGDEF)-like protein
MQIVFQFDVRAVALFIGMAFFVQAAAIGAQAYLIRELKQYRGVEAALLANLCVAVGLMLRLFADRLPEFFIVILSNLLIVSGPALFYVALSQFAGFSYSKALLIGILATVLCFLLYFRYLNDNIELRIISLSLGSVAVDIILIAQLWRTQKTALRFSANLLLVSFLLYGIFLILRAINMILYPPHDAASLTPMQSATYLFAFALSFFWSMGFILMVSQRLRNDLMEVATVDVLTRIPNRRATQSFLEKELSRAQRNGSQFSVLLLDIDNFKQVNDRWGHATGDAVLSQTAAILQSMIRKQDLVGRWGGEEFLIILPGDCDAGVLAERVRHEIANSKFSRGSAWFNITISIGVTCAQGTESIDQILRKADDALYRAKRTKNTVRIADTE